MGSQWKQHMNLRSIEMHKLYQLAKLIGCEHIPDYIIGLPKIYKIDLCFFFKYPRVNENENYPSLFAL